MSQSWNNWGPVGWPKPRAVVMEDRSTGTQYLLSHDSEADELILTTPVPAKARTLPEEPLIRTPVGVHRLFVENGELAAELDDRPAFAGIVPAPVFTLNYNDTRTTYLVYGSGTIQNAPLCLKKYTSLGITTVIEDLGCTLDIVAGTVSDGSAVILDTMGVLISDTGGFSIMETR